MPRLLSRLLAASLCGLLLVACTSAPSGVQAVRNFDLGRYLGTWHEIARLDHRFERGLSHVTATYRQRDDGGVDVLNRGYDPVSATWQEALGKAYFIGQASQASLKVSFFGPFYGGYHIFALDPDYRWAMVSGPSLDYLWILAREPGLDQRTLGRLVERARQAGFATDVLIYPASYPHPLGRPADRAP